MESYITAHCPHCKQLVFLLKEEFNCKIYRHGVYKSNYKQIDPHLNKEECDRLKKEDLIYGCGKPFQIVVESKENKNIYLIQKCGYI